MDRVRDRLCTSVVALLFAALASAATASGSPEVVVLRIDGAISPASAEYLRAGVEEAVEREAAAVVVELDTPGGLDTSMREMTRTILAAPLPVVVWVGPRGARAASAGTFIVYASHLAAMASATSIGAATPVSLGPTPLPPEPAPRDPRDEGARDEGARDAGARDDGALTTSERKAVNDAAAMLRSLGEARGRDLAFADAAVREAATLSSTEAQRRGVVEVLADDVPALLAAIEGRSVTVLGEARTLHVADAAVVALEPGWRTRVLSVLANPNLAFLLLMLGFYGLLFELMSPGAIVPGVVGAIALLLALFSLAILPVNFAGVALLVVGVALMVAEALSPSFGALGLGGLVAFLAGAVFLFDSKAPGLHVSPALIAVVAVASAAFILAVTRMAFRARGRPVVSGREQLIGATGVAAEEFSEQGPVRVLGELWRASTEAPLRKGQQAEVTGLKGLVLQVRPLPGGTS